MIALAPIFKRSLTAHLISSTLIESVNAVSLLP
jgi:hypothetical protein